VVEASGGAELALQSATGLSVPQSSKRESEQVATSSSLPAQSRTEHVQVWRTDEKQHFCCDEGMGHVLELGPWYTAFTAWLVPQAHVPVPVSVTHE
jgi:hypothetical protein